MAASSRNTWINFTWNKDAASSYIQKRQICPDDAFSLRAVHSGAPGGHWELLTSHSQFTSGDIFLSTAVTECCNLPWNSGLKFIRWLQVTDCVGATFFPPTRSAQSPTLPAISRTRQTHWLSRVWKAIRSDPVIVTPSNLIRQTDMRDKRGKDIDIDPCLYLDRGTKLNLYLNW